MNKKIKKTIIVFIMIMIVFIITDCATLFHDKTNPCSKGEYQNATECEYWKKKYPNEYKKYVKRLEKSNR